MTLRLRALPYRGFTVLWTFSPIRPEVLDRIEAALAAVLRHPDAVALRVIAGRQEPEAFAADVVERTPADLGTAEAMHRLQTAVRQDRPLRILLSHQRITFAVSHAMFDGLSLSELITAVFAAASGLDPTLDSRPPVRFALLRGLRAVGRPGISAWRAERHGATVPPPPARVGAGPGRSSVIEIPLDADLAGRIAHVPTGGRATPNARFASVALGALARVHRRDVDVPVAVPVSLLRHVRNGRVIGNFIGVEQLGSLHGSDWSPAAISARLVASTRSGAAMVGLVYAVARSVRHVLLPKRRRAGALGGMAISMQMLRLPRIVPDAAWIGDGRTTCSTTVGPWPSATVLAPFSMDGRWFVTVWDETDDFDLAAYPEALFAELADREAAAALSPR